MSSFHGRTRPDEPRIPQDLATKGYVDTINVCMIGFFNNVNVGTNGVGYWGLFNGTNRVGFTTAQTDMGLGFGQYINFHCNIRTNTKDGATIVGFRSSGFQTEVSLSVPASTTGEFSVNGLTLTFNEDTNIAGRIDTLLSTSGNFSMVSGHATLVVNEIGT